MQCPNCHREVSEGANYCRLCGTKLTPGQEPNETRAERIRKEFMELLSQGGLPVPESVSEGGDAESSVWPLVIPTSRSPVGFLVVVADFDSDKDGRGGVFSASAVVPGLEASSQHRGEILAYLNELCKTFEFFRCYLDKRDQFTAEMNIEIPVTSSDKEAAATIFQVLFAVMEQLCRKLPDICRACRG